jgi:hypothetical protein
MVQVIAVNLQWSGVAIARDLTKLTFLYSFFFHVPTHFKGESPKEGFLLSNLAVSFPKANTP